MDLNSLNKVVGTGIGSLTALHGRPRLVSTKGVLRDLPLLTLLPTFGEIIVVKQ